MLALHDDNEVEVMNVFFSTFCSVEGFSDATQERAEAPVSDTFSHSVPSAWTHTAAQNSRVPKKT